MELTIDNLYQVLNNTKYTEEELDACYIVSTPSRQSKFTRKDWIEVIDLLLTTFFNEIHKNQINIEDRNDILRGGMVFAKFDDTKFNDVTRIDFINFYPNIMMKLTNNNIEYLDRRDIDPYGEEDWEENDDENNVNDNFYYKKIVWNIEEFPILYDFIIKSKKDIKKYNNNKVYKLINIIINFTYGVVMARDENSYINCSNVSSITAVGRKILTYFKEKFPYHVVYLNTNSIWFSAFNDIKDEVFKILEKIDISYDIDNFKWIYINNKINHMFSKDSETDCNYRGIKSINNLREFIVKRVLSKLRHIESNKESGLFGLNHNIDSIIVGKTRISIEDVKRKYITEQELKNIKIYETEL